MSVSLIMGAVVLSIVFHVLYLGHVLNPEESADPFEVFWWWDNVTHYLFGIILGAVLYHLALPVLWGFLVVTILWEIFEYRVGERPWHTNGNGEHKWSRDHAFEDTVLDSLMGLLGVMTLLLVETGAVVFTYPV